jgi:hypothetical protein
MTWHCCVADVALTWTAYLLLPRQLRLLLRHLRHEELLRRELLPLRMIGC